MRINERGHLEIGGCDTVDLAKEFGTPLYVMDEGEIRKKCREYRSEFGSRLDNFDIAYASKAYMSMGICALMHQEDMSLDVSSGGELYTAIKAGFPMDRIYFHGNNKTQYEIEMGLRAGIGRFMVDNAYELELLNELAGKLHKRADIIIRVIPGIDAHTHKYIQTGQLDSKFGLGISDGQAMKAIERALSMDNIRLRGIHCHIGSQIFEMDSYRAAVGVMVGFINEIKEKTGYVAEELDLGGGFGIRYNREDRPATLGEYAEVVSASLKEEFNKRGLPLPKLILEPGRSIVGEAGITLYTIGSIKDLPGIRKYVAVDGGMADNPRVALYQAVYEAVIANKAAQKPEEVVSITGKCCESGDMLIWDIELPKAEPGDILAVFCTGAYNYSMSSNYNRLLRPAVVFVDGGSARVDVKRETYEDLVRNDLPLAAEEKERLRSVAY